MFLFFFSFRLSSDGQDFFTSYDEVYESFDAMGLQENLLRGIYAYGNIFFCFILSLPLFQPKEMFFLVIPVRLSLLF